MAKTTRESFKFQLRIPDDLLDRIRAAAEQNGRTVTAEMIEALTEKYPPLSADDLKKKIEELFEIIDATNGEPGYLPPGTMDELKRLISVVEGIEKKKKG